MKEREKRVERDRERERGGGVAGMAMLGVGCAHGVKGEGVEKHVVDGERGGGVQGKHCTKGGVGGFGVRSSSQTIRCTLAGPEWGTGNSNAPLLLSPLFLQFLLSFSGCPSPS